jgi:hypothetical protein
MRTNDMHGPYCADVFCHRPDARATTSREENQVFVCPSRLLDLACLLDLTGIFVEPGCGSPDPIDLACIYRELAGVAFSHESWSLTKSRRCVVCRFSDLAISVWTTETNPDQTKHRKALC